MAIPTNLTPKKSTSSPKAPRPSFSNMAIPLSDVQADNSTVANNDIVGGAGQPVLPADVLAAAIKRRMTDGSNSAQTNMKNTGWDNRT